LQLADYVAHVIFSVAQRGKAGATAAWRLLAPLAMRTEDGQPLKVRAIRDADQSPWQEERYQRFLP
jgi:predicted N-acetyltransferase YhbS